MLTDVASCASLREIHCCHKVIMKAFKRFRTAAPIGVSRESKLPVSGDNFRWRRVPIQA